MMQAPFAEEREGAALRRADDERRARSDTLYHQSVGRSCGLELNFAPTPAGPLPERAVAAYRQFGAWIRSCYGVDAASPGTKTPSGAVALGEASAVITLSPTESADSAFDRVLLYEDLTRGQHIREFNISVRGDMVYRGQSVGHKHIALLPRAGTGRPTLRRVAAQRGTRGAERGDGRVMRRIPHQWCDVWRGRGTGELRMQPGARNTRAAHAAW
eukprot:gene48260-38971_t